MGELARANSGPLITDRTVFAIVDSVAGRRSRRQFLRRAFEVPAVLDKKTGSLCVGGLLAVFCGLYMHGLHVYVRLSVGPMSCGHFTGVKACKYFMVTNPSLSADNVTYT